MALSATELRIGNYLEYKKRIIQFEIQDFREASNNSQFLDLFITPILITKQWLKDFGFITENGQDWFIPGNAVYKFLLEGAYIYYSTNTPGINIKIKYIHRLQNLYFTLTGKELKLKQ